ncbi:MAG: hypothetical protein ABIL37_01325 [candidate division WOR-3 bacterium]
MEHELIERYRKLNTTILTLHDKILRLEEKIRELENKYEKLQTKEKLNEDLIKNLDGLVSELYDKYYSIKK